MKKLFIFLVFFLAAYVFLIKGVTPLLMEVLESDWLYVKTDDPAETMRPVANENSRWAAYQCSQHLHESYEDANLGRLTEDNYIAWALGNYRYVIKGKIPTDSSPSGESFFCNIQWDGEDQTEFSNWEITQFGFRESSGIDPSTEKNVPTLMAMGAAAFMGLLSLYFFWPGARSSTDDDE